MEILGYPVPYGDNIKFVVTCRDAAGAAVNITGATGRATFRLRFDSPELFTVTSVSGHFTVPVGTDGKVHFDLPSEDYIDYLEMAKKYVFDVELTFSDGELAHPVQFQLLMLPVATQPAAP